IILCVVCAFILFFNHLYAQDTLPKFSVKNPGNNRIIISWTNNYDLVKQINIQRSFDSLKNYTTILNVADPMNKQNGFADAKATNGHMFYRLFIVLDKGMFYFTEAKKPIPDTTRKGDVYIKPANDTIVKTLPKGFVPSKYVFIQEDGYIHVNLPGAAEKKYSLKFYEEDGELLFELKDIKQSFFTLEKTNFYHAGWFGFELFENGILIERHKFFLSKDF
ncbi:MAG: hypothetical protein M3O67_03570, partial [Bacteroidota bacterium]|nr:hypothetical protein [Bacteroidota bacterium]